MVVNKISTSYNIGVNAKLTDSYSIDSLELDRY
jgi:hypothetical protein